jgi:predicted nucleotide-binding protein (sugar kinase/HSP70/actin superfamily)
MKVSFPHMGNAYIPLSALLSNLGAEVLVPPRPTSRTIDLGALHAPEFVCLPFKVNLGDNLRALQMGADTLAMVSGMWACRFGYYGRVQHQILRDAGFEFDSILLGREGLLPVYNKFRGTAGRNLPRAWLHALRAFKRKAEAMDVLESTARRLRPFEREKGAASRALEEGLALVHRAATLKEIESARDSALELISGVEVERGGSDLLQVAVLGEIYAVLEPSLNFDIERRLGEMGVISHPVMSVYKWLFRPLKIDPSILIDERRARRLTRPHIAYVLGGEEHQTIAGTITAARKGYDGVIHLYPFTCMPENICRSILPRLESEYDIPVLNLCLDEHASPTGMATRLEAFSDLLKQRRRKRADA